MKNLAAKLTFAVTAVYLSIGPALAEPCGDGVGLDPCPLPEPGTGYLLLAAVGAAAAIAKFRKK